MWRSLNSRNEGLGEGEGCDPKKKDKEYYPPRVPGIRINTAAGDKTYQFGSAAEAALWLQDTDDKEADAVWEEGTISDMKASRGGCRHFVEFDNGASEWVTLNRVHAEWPDR